MTTFAFTITNKTAVSVRVYLDLNSGHELGRFDVGGGATGHAELRWRPDHVYVRGSDVRGSTCDANGAVYGSARAFHVNIVTTSARRCEVHVYPVAS